MIFPASVHCGCQFEWRSARNHVRSSVFANRSSAQNSRSSGQAGGSSRRDDNSSTLAAAPPAWATTPRPRKPAPPIYPLLLRMGRPASVFQSRSADFLNTGTDLQATAPQLFEAKIKTPP